MKKDFALNFKFAIWAVVMMTSLMGTGLAMRALAMSGISTGENLVTRGIVCIVVVIIFSRLKKLTLRIKSPKTQLIRASIAGLALTFYTVSYGKISASAISVLSNIDVPLLLVLGPFIGMKTELRIRSAATISIFFLVCFIYGMEHSTASFIGLVTLLIGTILLCFGYWFIKQSMNDENEAVTIFVPAFAILFFGSLQLLWAPVTENYWHAKEILLAIASGICMFFAYFATMRLYRITDIASAEFPTLISSLLIQPIEYLLLNVEVKAIYLASSFGFVVCTFFILRWQNLMEVPIDVHAAT